jgi:hypothetical protein
MKRLFIAASLLLLAAFPAGAQTATTLAKVEQVFELTGVTRLMQQAAEQANGAMINMLTTMNPGHGAEIDRLMREQFLPEYQRRIPEFTAEVERLYALTFSDEELDAMITFYKSPLGKKMLDRLPGLMQQTTTMGQAWGQRVAREIIEQMKPTLRKKGLKI